MSVTASDYQSLKLQIKGLEEIVAELKRDIDLAFIFGLLHVAGGLDDVISEIHRTFNPAGVLSFEKTRGSEKKFTI
uniref:Uncharacterized protein n=1 Tax=Candidatus Methanophaga sp. ANME-1 ERB7 TaxID=2759913 RepID=A0A7G9Z6Z9_9EURY|nr:hypothetical protein GMDKCDLI_00012 [Methanosarcinales archaeon ANME-1 ERB7]